MPRQGSSRDMGTTRCMHRCARLRTRLDATTPPTRRTPNSAGCEPPQPISKRPEQSGHFFQGGRCAVWSTHVYGGLRRSLSLTRCYAGLAPAVLCSWRPGHYVGAGDFARFYPRRRGRPPRRPFARAAAALRRLVRLPTIAAALTSATRGAPPIWRHCCDLDARWSRAYGIPSSDRSAPSCVRRNSANR